MGHVSSFHPVERSQRQVRRKRDGWLSGVVGLVSGIAHRCQVRGHALRALLLEGDAPGVGIGARAVALGAHVVEASAQLRYQIVGAVARLQRCVTLLAPLLRIVALGWRVNTVHFGWVNLPLAVLVASG